MAGFVFCHFVNSVVDGVISEFLCTGGKIQFALACTCFGICPLLEVCLGGPDNLSEKLGELGGVLCLLKGIAPECGGDSGIALAVCLAAHGKVHSNFCALSVEVVAESLHDFSVFYNAVLKVVLAGEAFVIVLDLFEFF